MTARLSNLDLGISRPSYSTTTNSSFTSLYNPIKTENFAPNKKGTNVYFGDAERDYSTTSLCAEPFRGLPEKTENRYKIENSRSNVKLGYNETHYVTSSLSSTFYDPPAVVKTKHRRHLQGIYEADTSPAVNINKLKAYEDDVEFGTSERQWDTESQSQFVHFQNKDTEEKVEKLPTETQWSMGDEKSFYYTTTQCSYLPLGKKGYSLTAENGKPKSGSNVYFGEDKTIYKTTGLFSKDYESLKNEQ